MIEVVRTDEFEMWLETLKDLRGKSRIIRRIDRRANGNPGDARPIGKGLSELRLDVGPGYRVYYLQDADTLVLLLCGGDKSTQQRTSRRHTSSPRNGEPTGRRKWRANHDHEREVQALRRRRLPEEPRRRRGVLGGRARRLRRGP